MANLDALIEISKVARLLAGNLLYRRFISKLAVILLLVVITGMLAGGVLLGVVYAGYLVLIRHGVDGDSALLITGGVALLALTVSASLTVCYIRRLRSASPLPAIPQVHEMTRAFMDGFAESPEEHS